ncbi:bacillithiol system redox-active protein YtxJ [Candidatus Woesearchaeota archaeon]|nr:bacillithiol system redox-active protein YtxJ [Candidatus Woesearchaeota archaeon]
MYKKFNSISEISNNAIIFKHSNACPTSFRAKEEVDKIAKNNDVNIIIVQENRKLSNEIEEHYKIKHESPQIIIIKSGKVIGKLNHFDIKEEEINKILTKSD